MCKVNNVDEPINFNVICINSECDLEELAKHLSMNGYESILATDNSGKNIIVAHECEYYEVQTILDDRDIKYSIITE